MPPSTLPGRAGARHYAIATALVLAALALRFALDAVLDGTAPLLPFLAAAALAAWLGGRGPGLVATLLGGFAGGYFFVAPEWAFAIASRADVAQLLLYLATGALFSFLIGQLHALDHRLRLRAHLCDQAHDAIYAWERDGTIRVWTRGAERLYGFSSSEADGRRVEDLLGPHGGEPLERLVAMLDATHEWRGELQQRTRDGRTVHVESRLALVPTGADGELVLQADRDLSQRRRAELELEEQALRLRIALDGTGMHFWEMDLDSRRISASPAAFELHGMPRADQAPLDDALARVHADDLARVESALARAAAGDGEYRETYRVLHAGREPRWLYVAGRVVDSRGPGRARGRRLLGFLQDVTEARHAEADLRTREAEFRLLADSIPQLAWMARPDGEIFWFNRRWYEYTGLGPDESEGWGWQKAHDPFELPRVTAGYREALARGRAWEDTFPLRRHDGEMRWHLSRALPLRDAAGRVSLWFGTNTDITERLQMEEALRAADRRKDEFLATLAHELRNPLAPLGNGLQILARPDVPQETVERVSRMMVRQLGQMVRLIDDLLDVSRITSGKLELRRARVTLREVLDAALDMARPALEAAEHRIEWDVPAEPTWIDADATRLAQAFANLLGNAARYTPRGGLVRIVARPASPGVEVRVVDTGIGIPREALSRIFELFAQVRSAQEETTGGLGIGLSLVRALVALHGGTVHAESEGRGRGATFVVRLPLAAAPVPASLPDTPREGPAEPLARRRVLVADDNEDAAQSLAMLLRLEGCEVRVVHDGEAAVREVEEFVPHVVFMDVGMPKLDGLDATRRIRRQPRGREVRIVALTGWGQEADKERSHEAGVDRHLVKPIDPATLADLLA